MESLKNKIIKILESKSTWNEFLEQYGKHYKSSFAEYCAVKILELLEKELDYFERDMKLRLHDKPFEIVGSALETLKQHLKI